MSKIPIDHTTILIALMGTSKSEFKVVYYKDYSSYDRLPTAAKDPITKEEYDAYWKWKEENDI